MLLQGWRIEVEEPIERARLIRELRSASPDLFVLDTCQRLECYGDKMPGITEGLITQTWSDAEAFERLARIAAGLESRILGELEVLGQVRNAYKAFRIAEHRSGHAMDRVFQNVLALARKARKESGIDNNLTSISALAGRVLLNEVEPGAPLAVLGAGSLAGSVARYLSKRGSSSVRIASRCPENAIQLATRVGGFGSGLDDLLHLLSGIGGMITATAAPHPVLYREHIEAAVKPLTIIDLGVPPDCHQDVQAGGDVRYIPLEDIEAKAHINKEERRANAEKAARIVREGALSWSRAN
ncbi:MAG: hypothetical protein KJ626_05995 [Verrucomicrobia bacterium]|nr:hypothetical protein [Verrucomicrobiota bacterium]